MTPEQLDGWAETMREEVKGFFIVNQHMRPTAFLLATCHPSTGERLRGPELVVMVPEGDLEMPQFAQSVRQVSDIGKCIAVMIGTEAWLTKHTLEEYRGATARPSEDPKRVSALMISFERKGLQRLWSMDIEEVDGKFILGDELDAAVPVLGNFVNFINKPDSN